MLLLYHVRESFQHDIVVSAIVDLPVVQPKERIHGTYRWCTHMAKATSSPVVNGIMNVLTRRILSGHLAQFSFLGSKGRVGSDEQNTVPPITQRQCDGPSAFPLPLLELILDTIIVLNSTTVFVIGVGGICRRTFNVSMATCS